MSSFVESAFLGLMLTHMVKPSLMPSSPSTGECIYTNYVVGPLHWLNIRSSWFTQDEVNTLKEDGINAVRIPVSVIIT